MPAQTPYAGEKMLPMPADGFGSYAWWEAAIQAAEDIRKTEVIEPGKTNVERYRGKAKAKDGEVAVNVDFYNTEKKKAELFFKVPEVQLTAKRPGLEDAVTVFQSVINHKLGPHGVNAAALMHECLFDGLCPAGLWASKIGYEGIEDGKVLVQVGMKPGEPAPGAVLGLSTPEVPDLRPAPKIIAERYFWDRISPAKLLLPANFHGSDYDKAAWIGFEFVEDLAVAKRNQWVPEDFSGSGVDKHAFVENPKAEQAQEIVVGKEIWYRAARFDGKAKHPDRIRQLILIDGLKVPAVHRESPYQRFNPMTGKLIAGMKGYPVHAGALRYVSDTAYPPSDCTISRTVVDAVSMGHGQMVKQRDRSLPIRWFDRNRVDPSDVDRLKRADIQGMIPVDGDGSQIIGEVARAQWPRENFTFDQVFTNVIDKLWALGSNQQGVESSTVRSATELSLIQSNANVRPDYERGIVSAWFVAGAEKLGSLIQLFADQEDYIEIIGEDGEQRLQAWDKTTIQGEFAYSAKPDSAQRLDAAQDRKQALDFVNFMAKSQFIDQMELARWLSTKFNIDPARIVKPPQPPGPPPPSVSFRFSGDDFAGPASAIVLELAKQAGYQISDQAMASAAAGQARVEAAEQQEQQAKTEHGGAADKQEVISKHASEQTGQLQGQTSQPAVM